MSRRTDRLAAGMQRELAKALEATMPPGAFLTVTRVVISPDNRYAQVWVSGWAEVAERAQAEVKHNLQIALAKISTTKFTPRIEIQNDTSLAYAETIARLIKSEEID